METAVNPPIKYPEMSVGSLMFGLAHEALRDDYYKGSLSERARRYLILDNGADELGTGKSGQEYMNLIKETHPQEIILPDVLGDTNATLKASLTFLSENLHDLEEQQVKIQAVAQGETYSEYMRCYKEFLQIPQVKVIGVPYDIKFWLPEVENETNEEELAERIKGFPDSAIQAEKRLSLILHLKKSGLLKKQIHLLGTNNLWELRQYETHKELRGLIRSNDTTAPFAAAAAQKNFAQGEDVAKDWPRLDFDAEWDETTVEFVLINLYEYFRAAQDLNGLFNLGTMMGSRFPQLVELKP